VAPQPVARNEAKGAEHHEFRISSDHPQDIPSGSRSF
jgi:hypothetical protein